MAHRNRGSNMANGPFWIQKIAGVKVVIKVPPPGPKDGTLFMRSILIFHFFSFSLPFLFPSFSFFFLSFVCLSLSFLFSFPFPVLLLSFPFLFLLVSFPFPVGFLSFSFSVFLFLSSSFLLCNGSYMYWWTKIYIYILYRHNRASCKLYLLKDWYITFYTETIAQLVCHLRLLYYTKYIKAKMHTHKCP